MNRLAPNLLPLLSPISKIKNSPSFSPPIRCNCFISRRDITIFTTSSLIPLLNLNSARSEEDFSSAVDGSDTAQVREIEDASPEIGGTVAESVAENSGSSPGEAPLAADLTEGTGNAAVRTRAFLDVSIDGKPAGRILLELYDNDVPVGARRFSSLVNGAAGITYKRKEFIKIMPNYVQHGGIRSYGVDADLSGRKGNLEAETLLTEWEREYNKGSGVKNEAGTVSIIVRDPLKPPPKLKLVAKQGKLKIEEEEMGKDPNGTEFVINFKDSPELDASALVIGKVVDGMDVVERIGDVKTVQDNTSSPYFRVAKLIGDKRAVVAERGFNRPYSKVLVTNCGLLQ